MKRLFGVGREQAAAGTSIRITNPWHAVSIVCGALGCPAAKQLSGLRHLSPQAPKLPLAECDQAARCRCVYRHHNDRRAGPRRSLERGSPLRGGSFYPGEERRSTGGRRTNDG
jgi:hypothetical protein